MKKYRSLGELLKDCRQHHKVSQTQLASQLDVDIRSVIRWEKNDTLLNSEKEALLAQVTFIPYQVIRNLNTGKPIPTFYDFHLRKYSLTAISSELPEASWIKSKIDLSTDGIRTISEKEDIRSILRFMALQKNPLKNTNPEMISEAAKRFPEMNLILTDASGNYYGHCVYFTLKEETYLKIKRRTLKESDLVPADLINYRSQEKPVFYCHSITADSNENFFYIIGAVLKFYRDLAPPHYTYALLTSRYDSRDMSKQLGMTTVWEDFETKEAFDLADTPRLIEGDFNGFFKNH